MIRQHTFNKLFGISIFVCAWGSEVALRMRVMQHYTVYSNLSGDFCFPAQFFTCRLWPLIGWAQSVLASDWSISLTRWAGARQPDPLRPGLDLELPGNPGVRGLSGEISLSQYHWHMMRPEAVRARKKTNEYDFLRLEICFNEKGRLLWCVLEESWIDFFLFTPKN